MSYNSNVRATFVPGRFGKQASVVGLAFTFYTSVAIAHESDPFLAYILLFTSAGIIAVVHFIFTFRPSSGGENILRPNDSLQARRMFLPIAFGLITILGVLVVLLGTMGPSFRPEPNDKKFEIIMFLILAALAEEFRFRFVDMQLLPYAPITANALFTLLHPQVAKLFAGKPPDLTFAFFAFFFGLAMTGAVWLYEVPMGRNVNRGFGIVYAITVHAGYNAVVTIWAMTIAGFELRPF